MSRERIRTQIVLSGAVNPLVKRRERGGCDLDLGGGTLDELLLDLTDEQAKAIRDKLCLAYGLPAEAAATIAKVENPNRPMSLDHLPQEALDICAYITYHWRTLEDLATSYPQGTLANLRAKLHMLENAGLIESAHSKGWRKRTIRVNQLSKEGRRIYAALTDGWNDARNLAAATDTTPGVVRSCMKPMLEGGLAEMTEERGIVAHGTFQGAVYRLRQDKP